jgi:transcriptional regulator GlxA family with amidase domain
MLVTIFLFNGVTALDAVGPFEALQRLRDIQIEFVGASRGEKRTGDGFLGLIADKCIDEVSESDVLILPGGAAPGLTETLSDEGVLRWVRKIDRTTKCTASVCTGSLLLGAAGLLSGRSAATHFRARDALAHFGATYSPARLVFDGKYATSAGVSAGIDLGLALCERIAGREIGEAVELSMQYDPHPPFGTGNPSTSATADRLRLIQNSLRA